MICVPYVEPVFRPPSEAYSLILQVTNGCSWNKCTFCEMYTLPQKRFRFKPQDEIERELAAVVESGEPVRRIFLADGDAMTLSFRRLKLIMQAINRYLPGIQRVSSYCLPRNLKNKTVEELAELNQSLDSKVTDRTLALVRANKKLEIEVSDRKRAEVRLR